MRGSVTSVEERLRRLGQPWELAVFGGLPLFLVASLDWIELSRRKTLVDFAIFRAAGEAVLDGHSPFAAAGFVYPPVTALVYTPFAALPNVAARVLILALAAGAVVVSLRLLDVSDWRCYGLAFLIAPTLDGIAVGAITPFLMCATAAAWRYRRRAATPGIVSALAAVAKVFLWPLAVWLLATRRLRAAWAFAVTAVLAVVVGWAVVGFAGLTSYPHLLRELTRHESLRSYSVAALVDASGGAGLGLTAAVALATIAAVIVAARSREGDRRAFTVAIAGALLATPVLWQHYFMLLLVPIALVRPRLSGLWFAPLVLWATPQTVPDGTTWKVAIGLGTTLGIAAYCAVGSDHVRRPSPAIRRTRAARA